MVYAKRGGNGGRWRLIDNPDGANTVAAGAGGTVTTLLLIAGESSPWLLIGNVALTIALRFALKWVDDYWERRKRLGDRSNGAGNSNTKS